MSPTVPFPLLPEWLSIESGERPVALRSFGADMRDLAVEFAGMQRPCLVTNLLTRCAQTLSGAPPPEHVIWELPLSSRIQAILALSAAHSARPLAWRVRCHQPGCGAEGELELELAELEAFAARANSAKLVPLGIGNRKVWLRRPTGWDQRQWLEQGSELAPVAASLLVNPSFEELQADGIDLGQIGDSIDQAMDEYDPLVGFHLNVVCQECGRPTAQAPDLLAAALDRLWRVQFDLIEQVHRLASHYHWTEDEIAQVPQWRRQAYLACIDGGEL
jgi:hypothetical protein